MRARGAAECSSPCHGEGRGFKSRRARQVDLILFLWYYFFMLASDGDNSNETLTSLKPTQKQLSHLSEMLLAYEPKIEPLDGIPEGVDLRNMVDYTAPPTYNEKEAPSTVLRAPDARVIWLTTFRNPDSNQVTSQHILVTDPPINSGVRDAMPDESYTIHLINSEGITIEGNTVQPTNLFDVENLQKLIESSEIFNPFI